MAVDKLVDSTQLDADLTSVANAIRAKSGGSSQLAFPAGFVSEIQAIPSGGGAYEFDSVEEYTHAADWTTDALGNVKNFADTYLNTADTTDRRFRIAYIYENSWSGSYKASVMGLWRTGASSVSIFGAFQNQYPSRNYSSSNSWYLKAGSKIRVIYLKSIYRSSTESAP